MADPKIPLSDLPQGVPGAFDKVAGVDTATGASRLFPLPQPGVPRSYPTRASLPAASGFTEGYTVWVNNDPTTANNGTWAVLGGIWVQSADRLTGLEGRVGAVESVVPGLVADVAEQADQIDDIGELVAALGGTTTSSAAAGSAATLPGPPAGYRRVMIGGVAYAFPYYNYIAPIDLFVIVGQSNAEGRGDSAQSPAAPNGRFWNGSALVPLADPVGGANTGSMWPAFANEWYAATGGRLSAFVEAAAGGTGLLPGAGGQWSPSGTLRGAAVSAANAAIAAIASAPESFSPGKVYFVWAQGESDASAINGTTVTAELYEQALKDLAAYFKAEVPQMAGFHVISTGGSGMTGPLIDATQVNFSAIRRAQSLAAASDPLIEIAYAGAVGFLAAGLMKDALHYGQTALNAAGAIAAQQIAGAGQAMLVPTTLAATAFPYETNANATSRTISPSFNPAARGVLLFVHAPRISSYPAVTAMCGGVPMHSVAYSRADNAGRNHVQAFLLNSPSGLSGDIVISSSSSLFSIHCSVVEFSEEIWVTGVGGNTAATSASGQSHSTFSPAPATLFSAIGTGSSAASAVSFSGAIELHEASIYRAESNKHFTLALASVAVAANSTTAISTTHGATCDTLNAITVAVRRKLPGE